MKTTPKHLMMSFFMALNIALGSQLAVAQKMPPLPAGPPVKKINATDVSKHAEQFMNACKVIKSRILKGKGVAVAQIDKQASKFCFCVAKDVKRRNDVNEMSFLTKYYRDEIDDDAKLSDEQDIYIHELEKLEDNCDKDPQYRYGMKEPRLPDTGTSTSSKESHGPSKTAPAKK